MPRITGNAAALELTLTALESDVSDIDAAMAQAARALAAAVDTDPTNGTLWARYIDVLDRLLEDDGFDDDAAAVFGEFADNSDS